MVHTAYSVQGPHHFVRSFATSNGLYASKHSYSYYIVVITIVERDTRKYHEFIAEYYYECVAQVTIPKAVNE